MPKLISIIVPVYNEEKNISDLYADLKELFVKLSYDFEVIFINDGSTDKSYGIL